MAAFGVRLQRECGKYTRSDQSRCLSPGLQAFHLLCGSAWALGRPPALLSEAPRPWPCHRVMSRCALIKARHPQASLPRRCGWCSGRDARLRGHPMVTEEGWAPKGLLGGARRSQHTWGRSGGPPDTASPQRRLRLPCPIPTRVEAKAVSSRTAGSAAGGRGWTTETTPSGAPRNIALVWPCFFSRTEAGKFRPMNWPPVFINKLLLELELSDASISRAAFPPQTRQLVVSKLWSWEPEIQVCQPGGPQLAGGPSPCVLTAPPPACVMLTSSSLSRPRVQINPLLILGARASLLELEGPRFSP